MTAHRARLFIVAAGLAIALGGCKTSSSGRASVGPTYPIGTQIVVPPLVYTTVDTEWLDQLSGQEGVRLPKSRFLTISITVTNSGGADASIPLLSLVDSKGNEYMEESKGDGVTNWMGFLRLIRPAQTEQGRILFDVPPGAYKLMVKSGGDPEQEKTALVEIPFMAEKDPSVGGAAQVPAVPPAPSDLKLK